KQSEMQQLWPDDGITPIRYFIGDVRDLSRLKRAFEGVDIVIHAAAFKQVPAAEYNPFEAVKTNILGGQNVIEASMDTGVKTVVSLSSDKAVAPINLYGATKLAADKLFVAANNYKGLKDIKFSVFRYGNVMGSRGSVIPFFLKTRSKGVLPVTDRRMTRFNITLQEAVDFVIDHLPHMQGGEVFVPKIPSYRIVDLVAAIAPECEMEIVGMRPGEKLHEELVTKNDAMSTIEYDDFFVILPSRAHAQEYRIGDNGYRGRFCTPEFYYDSGSNPHFLTVDQLRFLLKNRMRNESITEIARPQNVITIATEECLT
ncbi:UDP-N-acetylglucosamine 4,6-dehydratase (inverting), partial [bacterium]|nr:UDP-N-acetylglucosamine 4,6-dehydratase (inverting) [bacterium]